MDTLVKTVVTVLVLAGFVCLREGRLVERRRAFGRPESPGHMPLLVGIGAAAGVRSGTRTRLS